MRKCCDCKSKSIFQYSFVRTKGFNTPYLVAVYKCPECGILHQQRAENSS